MTAATVEPIQVSLDRLVMDPDLQIRGGTSQGTVYRYAKAMSAGIEFPPVVVVPVDPGDPKRGFVLIDGWHRVEAVRSLVKGNGFEAPTVTAVVLDGEQDRRRWQWLAAQANQGHGLPLPYKRRRDVFRAYVKAGAHREGRAIKSARAMSKDLAGLVTHPTVLSWMRSDFPSIYRAMATDPDREMDEVQKGGLMRDRDEALAKAAVAHIEQTLAAYRSVGAQEVRDAMMKRAEGLLKALKEEPLRDYSDADAPWSYSPDW